MDTTYLSKANGYCGYQYTNAADLIPQSSVTSGMLQLTKSLGTDDTLKLQYFAGRDPAAIARQSLSLPTRVGVRLPLCVPSPSCPLPFHPHAQSDPSLLRATV